VTTSAPVLNELPRTKIVCTLGPSTSDRDTIKALILAGMNVARLNFSHGEHETHAANIRLIRSLAEELGRHVAILQDLQGPKIRTGKLKNGSMTIQKGEVYTLVFGTTQEGPEIPIDYRELAGDTHVGAQILLDDGLLGMKVVDIKGSEVVCEVLYGGLLKSRKGVNFPDSQLSIPSMTEKDTRDLLFGVAQKVDYVALSFVRTAQDVQKLKNMLRALGAETPVVSKIEMLSAIENIDAICQASDAIMVARGDLGVECGFANVASYQKLIVRAARRWGRPVIVATQMLDSMIENRRPTKAEICDVANAVFDSADATMLSGETASGRHPELVVRTMRDILDRADRSVRPGIMDLCHDIPKDSSIPRVIARTSAELAEAAGASAIVCLTLSGNIARAVAQYRPKVPIIAISPRPDVVRRLTLLKGVTSLQNDLFYDTDQALAGVGHMLLEKGLVLPGQLLVITGGIPLVSINPTNLVKLQRVAEVAR
jgi:pyruvate kinase